MKAGPVLLALLLSSFGATVAAPPSDGHTPDEGLAAFIAWLDREHHGYGCDDGPARFRNATVDAVYPGRRFYYVLTHARGIRPPFGNALSLVAEVGADGTVRPLSLASPRGYGEGLIRIARAEDARRAAAGVLVLALGDPGERRWPVRPELVRVTKSRGGWLCTYAHGDEIYLSRVAFDRDGTVTAVECSTPPVP